jgi:hypothetical protein
VTGYTDDSDEARYQRYRDLRNGVTLDAFRFAKDHSRAMVRRHGRPHRLTGINGTRRR